MKVGQFAVAAAMALGVSAGSYHHGHDAFHNKLHQRDYPPSNASQGCGSCGAYTVWVTSYGEATLYMPPAPPATSSASSASSVSAPPTSPATVVPVSSPVFVPTPVATTCPTPGVYTIPATTITVTEATTVCAPTTTSVPSGTHTIGGVTTVVLTSTTVVCPYAHITTNGGGVTSTILTTTYVCPSAGTYTIAPITTFVPKPTVVVYPTPASYAPGTYCQPEVVTTITEYDYVFICPVTSVGAPAPMVYSTTAAVAPAASTPASSVSASSVSLEGSGNKWAITYTPYTSAGKCKAESDVMADMVAIKAAGFSTVRLYATDCSGLEFVGAGCEAAGLKIIIGVFIDESGITGAQEQVNEIVSWAQWQLIVLIVIGNEAIFNSYLTPSQLTSFVSSSSTSFKAAGYTGPCTTTEPLNILQEYASLICPVVDVVGCNIHPFFNGAIDAASAGSFVASQLTLVEGLCQGKSGINLETGWPSAGECNGVACPSPANQETAVMSILSASGDKSVIFSFINDDWKQPGAFQCEQSWGAMHLFEN